MTIKKFIMELKSRRKQGLIANYDEVEVLRGHKIYKPKYFIERLKENHTDILQRFRVDV